MIEPLHRLVSNRLALGCGSLGTGDGGREASYRLLDAFVDLGGEVLDTAAVYSDWAPGEKRRSETIIGEWLTSRRSRNRVKIITKGGHPPFDRMSVSRLDSATLKADIEGSFAALGTDYIDLYLLHRDDRSIPAAEIFGTLAPFVEAGRIGSVGCSNWAVDRIAEARALGGVRPEATQILGNVLWREMSPPTDKTLTTLDEAAYRQARAEDLTLMLFTSQAQGALTKARDGRPLPPAYDNAASRARIAAIRARADSLGIADSNQLALAALLTVSPRMMPVVGAKTLAHLKASMAVRELTLDIAVAAEVSGLEAESR